MGLQTNVYSQEEEVSLKNVFRALSLLIIEPTFFAFYLSQGGWVIICSFILGSIN
jgi:hypothetical protein